MIRAKIKYIAWCLLALAFVSPAYLQSPTTSIKVYFSNERLNPNIDDCKKVFPVKRTIPKTKAIAKASLKELFKGTTKEEEALGYGAIPESETNGILKSINVKNGAAYVNFTKLVFDQMGNATTSCGGGQYFGMIEKTLTQFATIKKVYYAIEGNTDDFYDWVQVGECPYGKRHCSNSNFK
ncbi:MAG: GerMN domain-containing protein [Pyrinomonadaceae bacterium]